MRKFNVGALALLSLVVIALVGTSLLAGRLDIETRSQTLHGTLIDTGSDALVIIIPGSGPTDRDGNSPLLDGYNDSLRMLARGLEENGLSSYRYDKQNGESTPVFDVMIEDLVDVVRHFKEDGQRSLYLAGHSQGALVAMAAAEIEPVAGVISICGAGRSIDQTLADQLELESIEPILERVRRGDSLEEEDPLIQMMFNDQTLEFIESWMAYDPAGILAGLEIPVMLVSGTMDQQVREVELTYLIAADPEAEVVDIDGMNHVLKLVTSQEENLDAYTSPDYPISDILIRKMVEFVQN